LIETKLSTMDVDNGEDLSPDDIWEIHRQADEDTRVRYNLNVNTRNKRGEIDDYLEIRRPLGAGEGAKV
jgi:hypothetical protein